MSTSTSDCLTFQELALPKNILTTLDSMGYNIPTPIQAQAIPSVLEGRNVLGQAQTGTGKTAAFGLPLLGKIDTKKNYPQVLILAPTRELVAQICESLKKYAQNIPGVKIAAIYGGQGYRDQLSSLRRGVHIVVGTPGRVMDHIKRKTLDLASLECLVLDEADEMLNMGFAEDVEWICSHIPEESQKLLFSATMPHQIKHIVKQYLNDHHKIQIAGKTSLENIRQRYWRIQGTNKLDALSRILETEETDGVIIFARTKASTIELAEQLSIRGFATQALNGDLTQEARENAIQLLKDKRLNILVATDVAARGLDVKRISHVINYDMPFNPEVYVHRIGRTGRAGRSGEAILFVANRERNFLRNIERTTKQIIEPLELPSPEEIAKARATRLKEKIVRCAKSKHIAFFEKIVEECEEENELSPKTLAAALMILAQGKQPLILEKESHKPPSRFEGKSDRFSPRESFRKKSTRHNRDDQNTTFKTFRLEVGRNHGVMPGNILGAIANEGDLDRDFIGNISIFEDFSTVDLPNNLPNNILSKIGKARSGGKPLQISEFTTGPANHSRKSTTRKFKKKDKDK